MSDDLPITATLSIPGAALTWTSARSSGPGGQNVNKVASKIELRLDIDACDGLDEAVRARLRAIARTRLDAEGKILVVSQLTRDRARNLDDAREKIRALVLQALTKPKARRATRPTRSSQARRLDEKRRHADRKTQRRGGSDD